MSDIKVDRGPSPEKMTELGVTSWPVWTKEVSTFAWSYSEPETCYFVEGEVVVTPDGGEAVTVGKGDLVTFPAGMSCTWDVRQPVKKHYTFG